MLLNYLRPLTYCNWTLLYIWQFGLGLWCLTPILTIFLIAPLVSSNSSSDISWRPVLLVEETGVSGENHRHVASDWQTLSHILYRVYLTWAGFELTTLVVTCTDCICSYPTAIRSRPRRFTYDSFLVMKIEYIAHKLHHSTCVWPHYFTNRAGVGSYH